MRLEVQIIWVDIDIEQSPVMNVNDFIIDCWLDTNYCLRNRVINCLIDPFMERTGWECPVPIATRFGFPVSPLSVVV